MRLRLNLGCGYRKIEDCVNIDIRSEVEPDLVSDCLSLPYENESVYTVFAMDFLEHVPIGKTIQQIEEIYRVLKPKGKLMHYTPSTDGRGAFQDPTHVSFWNINSWLYYMDDQYIKLYGIKAKFSGKNRNIWSGDRVCHVSGVLIKEVLA